MRPHRRRVVHHPVLDEAEQMGLLLRHATVPVRSKKKAHLLGFVQHGVMNHASTMWAHPRDKVGYHWSRPEYWRDLGRIMERGLFDAMFIADELAPYTTYKGNSDPVVKYAGQCPVHEPATLVPIIGAFTK